MRRLAVGMVALLAQGVAAWAGEADVVSATAERMQDGRFRFTVTVRHDDTGWDHYADRWEVVAPDGSILATRVLRHPHVGQQPFTRQLEGVAIPAGISRVTIRAHDLVHEHGGATVKVDFLVDEGPRP